MRLLTMFILLFSILLGGCSSSFRPDGSRCIKTALVSSLSQMPLSSFISPDSRRVTISAFKAGCGGSSPDLPGGYNDIGINLTVNIPDAPHPTGNAAEITAPLFVALLDHQDNVLDRQDETIRLKVSDDAFSQAYKITYHPPEGVDPTSAHHKILVGFNGAAIKDPLPHRIVPPSVKKKVFHKKKIYNSKKACIKKKKLHKLLKINKIKKKKPRNRLKNRKGKTKKANRWQYAS